MEPARAAALDLAPIMASVPALARDMVRDRAAVSAAARIKLATSEYHRRLPSSLLNLTSRKKPAKQSIKAQWYWLRLLVPMAVRAILEACADWAWALMR